MTKQFIADVIQEAGELTGVAAKRITEALIEAIESEILNNGQFLLPGFGKFILRETAARNSFNPRTGEPVTVEAGATVRFKVSPSLRDAARQAVQKRKRPAKKPGGKRQKAG